MSDTSPLILHGLTKRFGHKLAVNNVSLELHEGEVFGFFEADGRLGRVAGWTEF